MAVGTVYNSNSMPGTMSVGNDVDLYEINSTQKYALGTQITRVDGNRYRYTNFVTATTQGKLVSHVVADVDNDATDALVTAPVATYQMNDDPIGVYPGAIGSKYVIYTLAAVVKDQFAGGYLSITLNTGVGYIYRIKGNTATDNPASGKLRIELYDRLQVALDATSDTSLVGSLYSDCKAATPGTDYVTVGVTMANMTANTFGWICTKGICICLQDGVSANGDVIQPAITTAGAIQTAGVGTTTVAGLIGQNFVGYMVKVNATNSGNANGYSTIFLQLD